VGTESFTYLCTTQKHLTMQETIDKVIAQIQKDISEGDLTALEELLKSIPVKNLEAYLPE